MAKFIDSENREWKIRMTVGSVARIREETGIDIVKSSTDHCHGLLADDEKFISALYVLCEDRIDELGMTPGEFAGIFDGITLENAAKAWLEEATNFFPRSQAGRDKMKLLNQRIWEEVQKKELEALAKAEASLQADPQANK